ncbi:hypothetical protein HK100_008834 [Physocladia obscura]|uniref:RUN domain-containing protein n=1 Tax=Physocladia obscura TaxID=109957 RepID=A0AAD5XHV5_9FUNG|nr:hypothetical protein HK100_008834 [Physocladia obscura]
MTTTEATILIYAVQQSIAAAELNTVPPLVFDSGCEAENSSKAVKVLNDANADNIVQTIRSVLEFRLRPPRDQLITLGMNLANLAGATNHAIDAWPFVSETLHKFVAGNKIHRDSNNDSSSSDTAVIAAVLEALTLMVQSRVIGTISGSAKLDAFIRFALMHNALHRWLSILVTDRTSVAAYYEQSALMRDKSQMAKIIAEIDLSLSTFQYKFDFKQTLSTVEASSPLKSPSTLIPTIATNASALASSASANASALASSASANAAAFASSASANASALATTASTNASAFASTAFEIGKNTSSTASIFATNAFGFGLQTLVAAKESLDSKIITLSLGSKKSNVDLKVRSESVISSSSEAENSVGGTGGVQANGGAMQVTSFKIVNVDQKDEGETEESILTLKTAFTEVQKQLAAETRLKLQTELISAKQIHDREIALLKNENMMLKKLIESLPKAIQSIDDI